MDPRDILKVVATRFIGNLVYVSCVGERGTKFFFVYLDYLRRIVINRDGENKRSTF